MSAPYHAPTLSYPFASRVSPYAAEVDAACFRWGERMGIYHLGDPEEFRRMRVGWLAGVTCPRGTRTGLRLLADWQTWLFAFDDGVCDESDDGFHPEKMIRRAVGLLGVFEGVAPAADDPFAGGLADLWVRLTACSQGFQRARFAAAASAYLTAQCWESVNRAAGVPPGLAEYVHMRRHSSAVRTCLALIDVAGGFVLTAEEYDHPEVVALTNTVINVVCWANDLLSYPKEVRRSRAVHSLPVVLGHERRREPREMVGAVVEMHDREVRRYLDAEERVRGWAGEPLLRYLADLRSWISGNLHWSRYTGRYRASVP